VVLLWDGGSIHLRKEVKQYIAKHRRLRVERFPAYAPELNPAEYVWGQTDRSLANSAPQDLSELSNLLRRSERKLRGSQKLLWSCIYASKLPWAR
jgi:putative transposase